MCKKDTTQLVCIAEFFALNGKEQELLAVLHSLMGPTHKEPGCLRYELNQDCDDPRRITFVEKWKDRDAFDQHCATSYIKNFFDHVRPTFVERFEVKLYWEVLS
ncbi:Antibiotic biosynthesis monooxygenase [Candidatus Sulfotelmatomonas gaucii]|uniref:Antibiotic biosynthesis monooxygenase n=1 Tax=Candidatus Sulfuritelmatomonas gaucii TaxID=2043161 RepID=A0A2N9L2Y3_9BACT|nr:Antibiotic biosynthesis monooxygenase [Candidatus Sulfotelmatomonas gaucii]